MEVCTLSHAKKVRDEISLATSWIMRKSFVVSFVSSHAHKYIEYGLVCLKNDLTFREKWKEKVQKGL